MARVVAASFTKKVTQELHRCWDAARSSHKRPRAVASVSTVVAKVQRRLSVKTKSSAVAAAAKPKRALGTARSAEL
eukprot:8275870-Alexandrium_andersonii.AAC.1